MRYIIEIDARAVKEYKRKSSAINYARDWHNAHRWGEVSHMVIVHEFNGRHGNIVWSNRPIA